MKTIFRLLKAFYMSFGMFCAIPLPRTVWDESCTSLMLVFFPVTGLIIGALWYGLYLLLGLLTLPLAIKAVFLMLLPFLLTGFLHLDGFMDTSDALLSRRPLEDKLRILKDPHTGAFAVISLGVVFVLWFAACFAIMQKTYGIREMLLLLFIPVLSRAFASLSLLTMKTLEQSSFAAFFKKGTGAMQQAAVIKIAAAACAGIIICAGLKGAIVCAAMLLFFGAALFNARHELKGVSGDTAGYALIAAETGAILAMAIL